MKVHGEVGGRVEVVVPTEMVGIILGLEPSSRFSLQVDVEEQCEVLGKTMVFFAETLFPLSPDVEIADLVAQCDQLRMPCDSSHSK